MRKVKQLRLPFMEGPLAEPIVVPFDLDPVTGKSNSPFAGLIERINKLGLLKKHYGVDDWMLLAYALAIDFVPGFRIVYDDPLAAKLGLPDAAGAKGGAKGKGQYPELTGARLIASVSLTKIVFGLKDDAPACALIAEMLGRAEAEHGRRLTKQELKALANTLASTFRRRLAIAKRDSCE